MPYIMKNHLKYSGGSVGDNSVELTMAEYEALEASGDVIPNTTYYITDAGESIDAGSVTYDNSDTNLNAVNVQEAIDENTKNISELNKNINNCGDFLPFVVGANNTTYTNVTVENISQFKSITIILDIAGGGVYATASVPMSYFIQNARAGTPLRAIYRNQNGEQISATAYYIDNSTIAVSTDDGYRVTVYGML